MNWNRCLNALGFARSVLTDHAARLSALPAVPSWFCMWGRSGGSGGLICHGFGKLALGELAFLILWRYFCSWMCPVLRWKSRDACAHGVLHGFSEGRVWHGWVICLSLWHLGSL